jgi:hypothetical protein
MIEAETKYSLFHMASIGSYPNTPLFITLSAFVHQLDQKRSSGKMNIELVLQIAIPQ